MTEQTNPQAQQPTHVMVPIELAQRVLTYIGNKPFAEVDGMVQPFAACPQVTAIEQPAEAPEQPAPATTTPSRPPQRKASRAR